MAIRPWTRTMPRTRQIRATRRCYQHTRYSDAGLALPISLDSTTTLLTTKGGVLTARCVPIMMRRLLGRDFGTRKGDGSHLAWITVLNQDQLLGKGSLSRKRRAAPPLILGSAGGCWIRPMGVIAPIVEGRGFEGHQTCVQYPH